ncbi:MAG: TatD family hydrolase, partial [Desulfarculales bacterium]|nr:TatD family hydrolase [Desulfarculales bacterium]
MTDSHAHLEMLKDLPQALINAKQAGVRRIVTVGTDLSSSRKASVLAGRHEHVFHTIGLHPHEAGACAQPGFWNDFRELAIARPPRAIGECGFDFFRNLSPPQLQSQAFAGQIEIALELGLPLVVHDREAHRETLDMLKATDARRVGGVLHCFSGDLAMAEEVLSLGFYLGIPGVITYKKNQSLRDLVKLTPPDRLLLETDCPFLSPEPKRGQQNQPAYMAYT